MVHSWTAEAVRMSVRQILFLQASHFLNKGLRGHKWQEQWNNESTVFKKPFDTDNILLFLGLRTNKGNEQRREGENYLHE